MGSEMCIRDRYSTGTGNNYGLVRSRSNNPIAGQLTLRFRN